MIGLSSLIAVPLGVFSGVYLAEFTSLHNKFAEAIRFISDVLAGVPSIVLGYVGFLAFVRIPPLGILCDGIGSYTLNSHASIYHQDHRTLYQERTRQHQGRRDCSRSRKSSMINRLTLRFALPGIITGVMLAVSISFSETAPLLYTADFNNYLPILVFHQPVGFLTYIVYVYSNLPYQSAHNLAYAASFVLLSFVFVVNLFARVVLKRFSKI